MNRSGLKGEQLGAQRAGHWLFAGLDFALEPGELALVTGPNGAGKTTLLRMLAGLSLPSAGSVTWDGVPVRSLPPESRGAIVYRGHLDALKLDLSVTENLEFYRALHGTSIALEPLLEQAALAAAAGRRVRHLSAGQRRRAALAALKVAGARLWVLDEPTTNLDRAGRGLVVDWLREHRAGGGSAIVATHQPDELAGSGTLVIEL